ncbi:MAG: hypothetical protein JW942_00935 [Opitutales bacterium]|nr:hypothetical protein [Opitutales bacterium]
MDNSDNWFRSENEDLRMDGKALEVSSIEKSSELPKRSQPPQRPFAAEIKVVRGGLLLKT